MGATKINIAGSPHLVLNIAPFVCTTLYYVGPTLYTDNMNKRMWKLSPEALRIEQERRRSSVASKHKNKKRYVRKSKYGGLE